MMTSIFVEDTDDVTIEVHYKVSNGVFSVEETSSEDTSTLKMVFRRPDFSISQRLVAASMAPDNNGGQSLNLIAMQNHIIYFLAKSWNVTKADEKGEEVPVELNAENIGKMRVDLARAVIEKLMPVIGRIL